MGHPCPMVFSRYQKIADSYSLAWLDCPQKDALVIVDESARFLLDNSHQKTHRFQGIG